MRAPMASYLRSIRNLAVESNAAPRYCPVAIPGHLMPYEAVAKAIFIRANGPAAYYKATGTVEKDAIPALVTALP